MSFRGIFYTDGLEYQLLEELDMKRVPDVVELLPLSRRDLHHRVIGVYSAIPLS